LAGTIGAFLPVTAAHAQTTPPSPAGAQTLAPAPTAARLNAAIAGASVIGAAAAAQPTGDTSIRPFQFHAHPGEEIIYVLEGELEYVIGGKPVRVKPGDVLFVPAGIPHSVTNVGSTSRPQLATYTVEKGKPLITLVKRAPSEVILVAGVPA
jgi:mannose-6-phosphate isomerase-like protein (cupin superfamily)